MPELTQKEKNKTPEKKIQKKKVIKWKLSLIEETAYRLAQDPLPMPDRIKRVHDPFISVLFSFDNLTGPQN